jgi:hypothetical protein
MFNVCELRASNKTSEDLNGFCIASNSAEFAKINMAVLLFI